MNAKRKALGILAMVLILAQLSCSLVQGSAPTIIQTEPPAPTNTPEPEDVSPKPGLWRASTETGEFTFVVNSKGTGVNEYDFGGVNVKTDDEEGYPITNGEFGSHLSFIQISGKFESNTSASGTWKNLQQAGSGAWTATWVGEK